MKEKSLDELHLMMDLEEVKEHPSEKTLVDDLGAYGLLAGTAVGVFYSAIAPENISLMAGIGTFLGTYAGALAVESIEFLSRQKRLKQEYATLDDKIDEHNKDKT